MSTDILSSIDEPQRSAYGRLVERCDKAGIYYELDEITNGEWFLTISINSGRDERHLVIFDVDDANRLNQVEFEKYVHIPGYEAIFNASAGTIEALIKTHKHLGDEYIYSKLLGHLMNKIKKTPREQLVFNVPDSPNLKEPLKIRLSPPSNEFIVFSKQDLSDRLRTTITIQGLQDCSIDDVSNVLIKLSNDVFFALRCTKGLMLMLEKWEP